MRRLTVLLTVVSEAMELLWDYPFICRGTETEPEDPNCPMCALERARTAISDASELILFLGVKDDTCNDSI